MIRSFLLFCACVAALTVRADTVVFSTLGPGNTYDRGSVFYVGGGRRFVEHAAQFTAQAGGVLSTIELGLTRSSQEPVAAVNVFLYGDANGSPDNANQIFLGSADPVGIFNQTNNSIATFAISGNVEVTLGSIYWLVLKPATSNGLTYWNYSSGFLGQMRASTDDATWNPETPNPSDPPIMAAFQINAVPEPASTALLGLAAVIALGSTCLNRNRKAGEERITSTGLEAIVSRKKTSRSNETQAQPRLLPTQVADPIL